MSSSLYDLNKLIEFRHWMHENAELSYKEFNTQKKIKEYLLNLGIEGESIKVCANTGLIIDIYGKGDATPDNKSFLMGARADIDALPMAEFNDLPYKSKTNAAHMCGHDGHVACLLGGISLYLDNLEKIPSNRGVRFLFQPAEEGAGGAKLMVKEGCLEGLQEIYGMHNIPNKEHAGKICVQAGKMMAGLSVLKFKIIGKGGHGSRPESCKNPVPLTAEVYLALQKLLDETMKENPYFRASIPKLIGSHAFNVIPEECFIEGTLRSFKTDLPEQLVKKMEQTAQEIVDKAGEGFRIEFGNIPNFFRPVINDKGPTEWVQKTVDAVYGSENNTTEGCSIYASEDFSDFTVDLPGCFWFTAHGINNASVTLHSPEFLMDDTIVEPQSKMWQKLFELRLNSDMS